MIVGYRRHVSISEKHSYIYSSGKRGVYLLKPDDTIVRFMTLPKMKKREIDEAVVNEYLTYAAMSGGTPYVNWKIVSEEKDKVNVLAIGVKKEYLDEIYINIMKTDKVKIFSAVASIGVVGELVKDLSEESNFGAVFIGNSQADLIFYKDGEPIYGRNINIGVKDIFHDVGVSERDISDFLSYIDEAIIRNFEKPVKVYIASIDIDDKKLVSAIGKFSSYEIISFNELVEIAADNTHEALLRAAWNLGMRGHPLYVFVPPAFREWQKAGRRVFYVGTLLIVSLLFGAGSINLSYMKLQSLQSELNTKHKQIVLLKEQISKLEPYEKKYETLKKNYELLSKLAFIENSPHRYYAYYFEIGKIVFKNKGILSSISGSKDMLNLSLKFSSEKDMLLALSEFKKSTKFARVVVYSTSKSNTNNTPTFVLSIGVELK